MRFDLERVMVDALIERHDAGGATDIRGVRSRPWLELVASVANGSTTSPCPCKMTGPTTILKPTVTEVSREAQFLGLAIT
jgi:hypothetical protein